MKGEFVGPMQASLPALMCHKAARERQMGMLWCGSKARKRSWDDPEIKFELDRKELEPSMCGDDVCVAR